MEQVMEEVCPKHAPENTRVYRKKKKKKKKTNGNDVTNMQKSI